MHVTHVFAGPNESARGGYDVPLTFAREIVIEPASFLRVSRFLFIRSPDLLENSEGKGAAHGRAGPVFRAPAVHALNVG
jgi:hypothetical protein